MKPTIITQVLIAGLVCGVAHAHIYSLVFGLNAQNVVPPTDSTAKGFARFDYNHHTFNYDLDVVIKDVALEDLAAAGPNGTPLHIYLAPRGQTGDIVLDPTNFGDFVQDGDDIRLTVSLLRLGGQQGAFESNIFGNQEALYDGHLYMQLYTNQYPNGEIRGQIPPYGKFLGNTGSGPFIDMDGPPSQIPAPAAGSLLALAGLLATRRRRSA